jgi:hypothetical protein
MILDTPILFGGDPKPGPYRGRADVLSLLARSSGDESEARRDARSLVRR